MAQDALGAHARDELGLSDQLAARPLQAALASAATFAVGALLPILAVMLPPPAWVVPVVSGASLMCLAALGALAAQVGGGSAWRGACASLFGAPWPCWQRRAWERFWHDGRISRFRLPRPSKCRSRICGTRQDRLQRGDLI